MLMPLCLGTLMATNVVTLSPHTEQLRNIGCNDWFIAPGCFFWFCFPFSPPVLVHLFVRKEKKKQLKKIQPGMFAHWAVFSALCHAVRMHEVVHNTTNKWTIEGLTQWEVPKQTNKQTLSKGLLALVNMQCIPPMAICYLIVAVSKCMWLKQ